MEQLLPLWVANQNMASIPAKARSLWVEVQEKMGVETQEELNTSASGEKVIKGFPA